MASIERKPIHSVYVLKALCAIMVVMAHTKFGVATEFMSNFNLYVQAVSVFFAISGYFLYNPDREKTLKGISSAIKKVIPILIITQLVYLPLNIPFPPLTLENKAYYFKIFFLEGMSGHLWYLVALLQGLIFLWFYVKFIDHKHVIWCALLLITVRPAMTYYWEFLFSASKTSLEKNALVYSIPCLAIGMYIKQHEEKLLKATNYLAWMVFFTILAYLDHYYLKHVLPKYIILEYFLQIIAPFCFLLLALQHRNYGKGSAMEYIGKNLAGNIYYWHGLFNVFFYGFMDPLKNGYNTWGFLYVLITSTIFAWLVHKAQKRMGINVLR